MRVLLLMGQMFTTPRQHANLLDVLVHGKRRVHVVNVLVFPAVQVLQGQWGDGEERRKVVRG